MSEVKSNQVGEIEFTLNEVDTQKLKKLHDIYAVTHQVLTQKCTFYSEEFEFTLEMINFYKAQIKIIRDEIELREPKNAETKQD